MDVQINAFKWSLQKIEKEGSVFLGIPIAGNVKKYLFSKLSEFKKSTGWLVKDDTITEWKIEGFYNENEQSWFYGAYYNGLLLPEILTEKPGDWKSVLIKLAAAYHAVVAKTNTPFRIYTLSAYFLADGGVLFLPPAVCEEIITISSGGIKLLEKNIINHPDLTGTDAVSYTLGVISYKALTAEYPFQAAAEDDIRYRIRNRKLLPLHLSVPGIKKEESRFIMSALCQAGASHPLPGMQEWITRLTAWENGGLYEAIAENETAALETKAQKKERELEKNFRVNLFFHKYKWIVLTVSAVFLTIVIIAGTSIYNSYFKPRSTRHMSPLEIVQAYYKSINTIDFYTMEDCVINGAGKGDVNELVNIFVLTKQQSVLQLENPAINPEEWTRRGRPAIRPPNLLYGIGSLVIKELAAAPEPVFEAEYEKWYSEFSDENRDSVTETSYFGTLYKDQLYLKTDRGGWVIYRLERAERGKLEYQPDNY